MWGNAWFLAERRWVLWRYHRTRDGRRYPPDRNPEVALLVRDGGLPRPPRATAEHRDTQ